MNRHPAPALLAALLLCSAFTALHASGEEMVTPEFEAQLTDLITQRLAQKDVVGGAIVLLRGNDVVLERAYGVANAGTGSPVSPSASLYRMTSVTKPLTAMAVMRLVDEGKLDLLTDVRQYLDFDLYADFPEPITLTHLLTHTAGFEERSKDFYADPGISLAEFVRSHQPRRIFPPGRSVSYSNYGYALAGRIVELASKQDYGAFVAANFFDRLGLTHISVERPLPERLLTELAPEYRRVDLPAEPLRYLPDTPAGGLVASPLDAARLFNAGALADLVPMDGAVLSVDSMRRLRARQFGLHPLVDGIALGTREVTVRGTRALYQGGDSCCHHTDVYILPAHGITFLHAYAGGNTAWRREVWRLFSERLPSTPEKTAEPAATPATSSPDPAGRYVLTRRAERSMFALLYEFSNQVSVRDAGAGAISAPALFRNPDGQPRIYDPAADGSWRERGGEHRIAFLGEPGRPAASLVGGGFVEGHRVAWCRDSRLLASLLALSLATLLPAFVPSRFGSGGSENGASLSRRHRVATRVAALAIIAFVVVYFGFALSAQRDLGLLSARYDWVLRFAQGLAAAYLVAISVAFASSPGAYRAAGRWARVWIAGVFLAGACIGWALIRFHILQGAVYY